MSRKNISYDKPKSPFVRSKQKNMDEDMIWELMQSHLEYCVSIGECKNVDNGNVTSCDCVARINEDACVRNRCLESLVEFNGYDSKNQTLYLQGIALQGLILKQRKLRREKWCPEFHIKGVLEVTVNSILYIRMG